MFCALGVFGQNDKKFPRGVKTLLVVTIVNPKAMRLSSKHIDLRVLMHFGTFEKVHWRKPYDSRIA